jgi:hypothetical protein
VGKPANVGCGAIVLKNSIAGFGMKQWFTINALIATKHPQGDGKEQQYYSNRSAIEYSTTFSTQSPLSGHS